MPCGNFAGTGTTFPAGSRVPEAQPQSKFM